MQKEPLKTKAKFWQVTVTWKGQPAEEEKRQEVIYVAAKQRAKAERLAILTTADYWGEKTSLLESESEEVSKEDVAGLSPDDFIIYVAMSKGDFDVD